MLKDSRSGSRFVGTISAFVNYDHEKLWKKLSQIDRMQVFLYLNVGTSSLIDMTFCITIFVPERYL